MKRLSSNFFVRTFLQTLGFVIAMALAVGVIFGGIWFVVWAVINSYWWLIAIAAFIGLWIGVMIEDAELGWIFNL